MARVFKPPFPISNDAFSLFLAGSIEMGTAVDWQSKVEMKFENFNVNIFNPRRDDWDSSWEQKFENEKFREQVEWELNALESCDVIAMYFDPSTKSPISLLELGLFARTGKMIVCCPEGFWRKGNVDVVCNKYAVKQVTDLDALIQEVYSRIVLHNVTSIKK